MARRRAHQVDWQMARQRDHQMDLQWPTKEHQMARQMDHQMAHPSVGPMNLDHLLTGTSLELSGRSGLHNKNTEQFLFLVYWGP